MGISSITLFTKFENSTHKSKRFGSFHLAYEVRVKCSVFREE